MMICKTASWKVWPIIPEVTVEPFSSVGSPSCLRERLHPDRLLNNVRTTASHVEAISWPPSDRRHKHNLKVDTLISDTDWDMEEVYVILSGHNAGKFCWQWSVGTRDTLWRRSIATYFTRRKLSQQHGISKSKNCWKLTYNTFKKVCPYLGWTYEYFQHHSKT